ncbi:MAG: hypothetical protein DMD44_08565 [Gemmatimonadetes bacterium]|nr:MAG: hypothetical protein DMD44_08565 [Gemmatimonadota bacterium]
MRRAGWVARWCGTIGLALLAAPVRPCPAQAGSDTAVTVYGFLQAGDSGRWTLLLPQPVTAAGRHIGLLAAADAGARWARMDGRFVEVAGRVTLSPAVPGGAGIAIERLRELEPPGTRRNTVQLSFSQLAVVTLAAIPNRFAWRADDGQPTGVQPLLMYTVYNHGQTQLDFMLPTNDVVCVRVQRDNDRGSGGDNGGWHTSLPAPTGNRERIVIRLGGLLRRFIPIPHDAAPVAGRYVANVTLCGVADYRVETPFEVVNP